MYCIKKRDNGISLYVNAEFTDSLDVLNEDGFTKLWHNFPFEFMGNMLYFGNNINMLDTSKKEIVLYPDIKTTSALNFQNSNGINVNYGD